MAVNYFEKGNSLKFSVDNNLRYTVSWLQLNPQLKLHWVAILQGF